MESAGYFADLLAAELQHAGYTPGQAARRADLPKATVVNWLQGRVRHPRAWQDLLKLAAALHSDLAAVTQLLQAAGYPALAELQTHVTPAEQTLFAPWATSSPGAGAAPFQAIPAPPGFVGRQAELAELQTRLLAPRQEAVYCLHGMAGVGKTTLAAHLAYQMRPYFPDGVLWARLDTGDPLSIAGSFAGAYGRDVSAYPDLESRSRVLREVLAHKRALLVLDNAESGATVEPFLPPTGPCAVLVTTRRQSLQISARLHRIALAPFASYGQEARALFAGVLGAEYVTQHAATLDAIADLLGHLPLALTTVAHRLVQEPPDTAPRLLAQLQQEHRRLPELVEDHWNVELSFACSYEALPPAQQAAFAALSVLPGEEFSAESAAAVAGLDAGEGADTMRRLAGLSLIAAGRAGRYRLHPLLRDFARARLRDSEAPERLVTFFLGFVCAHATDYAALDQEWSNIRVALEHAPATPGAGLLPAAVLALFPYLEARGHYALAGTLVQECLELTDDAAQRIALLRIGGHSAERQGDYVRAGLLLETGLRIAQAVGAQDGLAALLLERGVLARQQGQYAQAAGDLQDALALAERMGNTGQQAVLLGQLGIVARQRGELAQAEHYYRAGLDLAPPGAADETRSALLASLSALAGQRGDYTQAEAYLREGLALAIRLNHQEQQIVALTNLGLVACRRGDYADALAQLRAALAQARSIGQRERVALLLGNLAAVCGYAGDEQAVPCYLSEGCELARTIGNPWLLCGILEEAGAYYLRQGCVADADATFGEMEAVAIRHGLREYQAGALYGRGQVAAAQGHGGLAEARGEESRALYASLSHPKLPVVVAWLAGLPPAAARSGG